MLYLLALVVPPIAVAIRGTRRQFLLNVFLTLMLVVPGILHAIAVVRGHAVRRARRRLERVAHAESRGPAASAAGGTWRGGTPEAERIRHGWQREWTTKPLKKLRRRARRRRLRVCVLLAIGCGLVAFLLVWILPAPVKTPLVMVTATDYAWPMAPNAWAQEDVDYLSQLDQLTFRIKDTSAAWDSKDLGMQELERQLHWAGRNCREHNAVVIYISMHGAVDADGRPCLVPPSASGLDSGSWLPLDELLDQIGKQVPTHASKLLILDCNRQLANWNWGLLYNGFAERLPETLDQANVENLVILNSTSPGQTGWAASQLDGSAFGHFAHLALAGAADGAANGGNGDGRVSLHELRDYVTAHVDQWSVHHRGQHQQPMLVPEDPLDFDVVQSLSPRSWQQLVADAESLRSRPPPVMESDIVELWKQHDRLVAWEPYRVDPLAWRDFQHKLLWLEMCNQAGRAYDRRARQLAAESRQYIALVEQQVAAQLNSTTVGSSVFSRRANIPKSDLHAHSVALARRFYKLDASQAAALSDAWTNFENASTEDNLDRALGAFQRVAPSGPFCEGHFLHLLKKYRVAELWPDDPQVIGHVAAVRRQGEQLAVAVDLTDQAADLRALAWAAPTIEDADNQRRLAEDALFAGQARSETEIESLLLQTESKYQAASEMLSKSAEALRTRDQVLGKLPYVAAWLARPLPDDQAAHVWDEQVSQHLLPLIVDAQRLSAAMAESNLLDNLSESAGPVSVDDASSIQRRFDQLAALYQDECQRLIGHPNLGATALLEIESLLAAPLLSWDNRAKLRELHGKITVQLHADFDARKHIKTDEAQTVGEPLAYSSRIQQQWRIHPAVAILNGGQDLAESDVPDHTIAFESEQVRRLLASVAGRTETQPVQAEHMVRTAAAFGFPAPSEDPISNARLRALQNVLLWHSRRALDDFLGPASAGETPFFALAAEDYLATASTILPPSKQAEQELGKLTNLLAQRRIAAENGVSISATDMLLVDPASEAATQCVIHVNRAAGMLPEGRLAVFLQDHSGRIGTAVGTASVSENGSDPPHGQVEISATVAADQLAGRGPYLSAVGLFRGNVFMQPLLLRVVDGTSIEFVRHDYGPSSVTLKGRRQKQASVVFLLDCSSSMQQPIGRSNEQPSPQTSRMDVAQRSLRGMLARLADRTDVRVGLRLFGHRVGWDTRSPDNLLRQQDYAREIPIQLLPDEDVELVLPLGRFDEASLKKISPLLATIRPWGESPLYLSLVQAMSDFDRDDPTTERSVVVITDGLNNQFNPSPATAKTIADVLAARGDQNVRIFVLGFGVPANEAEAARQEFSLLTARTHGQYIEATDAAMLIESLESLLRPNTYQVVEAQAEQGIEAQVGESIVVRPAPSTAKKYWVRTETMQEEIELAGGEAVEMVVDYGSEEIVVPTYRVGGPQFAPLSNSLDGTRGDYRVGLHQAVFDGRRASFSLSIQSSQQRFTPRPSEIWVEVTPHSEDRGRLYSKYIFYDANYEPARPVPLLRMSADDWPAEAKQAVVNVWLKWKISDPVHSVKVGEVSDQPPPTGIGFPVQRMPGVSFQARTNENREDGGVRVSVVEHHANGSAGVDALKTEIHPRAKHVARQFDAKHGVVLHAFDFPGAAAEEAAEYVIRFTRRADTQSDCWQLESPLTVNVYEQGDLIRLNPADRR